jgi:hypothetical protein
VAGTLFALRRFSWSPSRALAPALAGVALLVRQRHSRLLLLPVSPVGDRLRATFCGTIFEGAGA